MSMTRTVRATAIVQEGGRIEVAAPELQPGSRVKVIVLQADGDGTGAALKWRRIRGLARPSLIGEDAQQWVSRTRAQADEARSRQYGAHS